MKKRFNYSYYGTSISKLMFEQSVPDNCLEEVTEGTYSFGGFRAMQLWRR